MGEVCQQDFACPRQIQEIGDTLYSARFMLSHLERKECSSSYKGIFGANKLVNCIWVDVLAKLSSSSWYANIICSKSDLTL